MKECPKCNKEHEKPGDFCSRSCANSRERDQSVRDKLSKSNKRFWDSLSGQELESYKSKCSENLSVARIVAHEKRKSLYQSKPFEKLSWGLQRRKVIEDQDYKCAECGLCEWRGKPLSLEVDHKDGNNRNNSRDNLEALCPNCHSITPTWRGRNLNTGRKKVSDEELTRALKDSNKNIRQALLQLGMAAKGANYGRAKALLLKMDQ